MLKTTRADFKFDLPEPLLEDMAVSQARSLFTVNPEDEAAGTASMEDINETLRLMVKSTVNVMADNGYLTLKDDNVATRVEIAQGQLKLNGKVFESEAEPEFDDEGAAP